MVDAVTGRAALALLSAPSAADQKSNRKNPLLPTPLPSPQQGSDQRASAILKFDTPRVSTDVFSTLSQSALLSATRKVVVGEERRVLEAELRQSIQVIETPGTPGSPGTPDRIDTFTTRKSTLDAEALNSLGRLIDGIEKNNRTDLRDARLVEVLQPALDRFSQTLGNANAGKALGEIVGRLENSVIGRDGLSFGDVFRDFGLFGSLGRALGKFAGDVGFNAAEKLNDLIGKVGNRNFETADANDTAVKAVASAIDSLGTALQNKGRASLALNNVLDTLQDRGTGSGFITGRYADRVSDILTTTLNGLQGSTLNGDAVARVQQALQDVQTLENIAGRNDDRLRDTAVAGLRDILNRYTSETTETQTVVTPGEPATPGTPGTRDVKILEETVLVPKVEVVQRVITIYESVQASVEPLRRLSQPPVPTPNLQALAQLPTLEDKDDGKGFVIHAAAKDDEDEEDDRRSSSRRIAEQDEKRGGFNIAAVGPKDGRGLGIRRGSLVDSLI